MAVRLALSASVSLESTLPVMSLSSLPATASSTATGASFTGVPVIALLPVTGAATPSLTLVAMVKLPLKLTVGVKVSPASKVFTSAMVPDAVHTPVPALYVEVTAPDVPVFRLPAAALDKVSVTVTLALSTSLTTISVRLSGVSSV